MKTYTYLGPHDEVVLIGAGAVKRGETIATDLDLCGRPDFEATQPDLDALKIADLRALADERGIDHAGVKKPDLINILKES